ncbi:chemotaxis protein CheY [Microbacterium allomyrinae]|uniref:Chemotaxis protein CheY n=1 Tax=Microbacterium allomyrinae TaxID=2830666 RepID=A0A9X1LRV4_9MICO|nr:chemotaxis protein CheY [Microbacterium allomyrinae]MCC2030982.1 chemotaxis protein CheY [Microbacterium allomyrinae]
MTPGDRPPVRLAWAEVPTGIPRREIAWRLLRGLLAADAELTNPCPFCGGPHGPVKTTDAAGRPAIAYAGTTAVAAVADVGAAGGAFAIDAEPERDAVRDAAGLAGVLGSGADVHVRDWVRVEAALKADGRGLRVDPGDVVVTEEGPRRWSAIVPGAPAPLLGWDLDGPPGVLVSAAVSAAAEEAPGGRATP